MSAPSIDRATPSAGATRPRLGAHTDGPLGGVVRGARKLAEALATPLVPADYLDLIDPMRSGADLRGRIVEVRPETADAATVVIRPGRGWRGHVPGQYIRIGIDIDGVRHWRAYSLTHRADGSPAAGIPAGCIAITTKAIPEGKVSRHLVREAGPGTLVMLDQATGDFTLPSPAPAKVLFLTAGSGITPVMGMLRSGAVTDAVLVHSALTRDDVVFGAELRELAAAGRIRLVEVHNDTDGLLDVRTLPTLVPDLAEREVYTCGPTGLMDAVEEELAGLGLLERLHAERFRPSILAIGEGGTATFGTTSVEAAGDRPLLDVGEEAGVLMPSGCRMGICFGCVLPLREGAVRDLRSGDLTTAGPGVLVQTCVSAAAGACDLDV